MPYLRPGAAPSGYKVYTCCIPDSAEWRTLIWGALTALSQNERWEGSSALTDDEIRSIFSEFITSFEYSTDPPEDCP